MDLLDRAQVLLLCDLCKENALQSHCELCQINLCKDCVGEHLSVSSKRHNVVPYKQTIFAPDNPICLNHTQKYCELYCERCYIPVCSTCIASGEHKGHDLSDNLHKLSFKTKYLENDLRELEKRIYPIYEEIELNLDFEKSNVEKHYEKLTTDVIKQGEDWHREINIIVNKQKSEIDEMKTKHLAALNKQEKEIKQITSDVEQSILDLKKILYINDFPLSTAEYKSRNAEFRSLPPKISVSLPRFSPYHINTEQLLQMFGSLSVLSLTTEEHCYTMETPEAVSCSSVKQLLDESELITNIDTEYEDLYNVTCLSNEEIWTYGDEKVMKLYNLQGRLLKAIETKSGTNPRDIAVTRSGNLVYTDESTRTVNLVKNKQIQEMIRLQGWIPCYVCSTISGDLLVSMNNDNSNIQSKVVRYSGSTEKQIIEFDNNGKPLYSSGSLKCMYISENRNLDICVADNRARTVVVVNRLGKLRFRYTGHLYSTKKFIPCGITTDSQLQILTADYKNNCIHIIDQDGQFLCYLDNCDLYDPWGLCIDTNDNLFVAEHQGNVKKIKYM
ncbi:E3 ubiquitin-protein ligase TRIM36-like [Saccostrea echinata]|uniref:E3 ubiquitin-protein ligase TRIM36-like n=1 Tax=Saccostrea echinata TaxID=191078 RepID=UPI002A835463|nr:E3 ubiquitin-protein ligase TRIM36-like [Saccostrea echinata]